MGTASEASGQASPTLPSRVLACGFSFKKRMLLRQFVAPTQVRFVGRRARFPPGSTLLLWGSADAPTHLPNDCRVIRVEDGFLRSVGLGAELVRPLSWVFDSRGIYYDPAQPSDLEHWLQTAQFAPDLLARAAALRERIVRCGVTKYSVGQRPWHRPANARRVILVPGQVESDASVGCGAPQIRSNLGLVRAVRQDNPHAYLIYKPHPDVDAGLRAPGCADWKVASWCDEVVTDVAMGELLRQVDEVHVMTSLTGFEALLRGKLVVCYGLPFYAGWQLTHDRLPIARRTRRLLLDELVAGALIAYPRYMSRVGASPGTPESTLDELLAWRASERPGTSPWRHAWRYALRLTVAGK